jgi:hypothetical protein
MTRRRLLDEERCILNPTRIQVSPGVELGRFSRSRRATSCSFAARSRRNVSSIAASVRIPGVTLDPTSRRQLLVQPPTGDKAQIGRLG